MIEFGVFGYDSESRVLSRDTDEIPLSPRVLAVLESLLKRPGKIVAKEAVLESAWEGAFVGEDSLTQAISQLRNALGDDPQRPRYIQTIPKRGYRFIAEVSEPLRSNGPIPEPVNGGGDDQEASAEATHASPSTTPELTTLAAGTRVGNYELLALIGAGAMGEVWRARDTELQRDVAIKVVPKELAGEAAVIERFRREAVMLAAVNHPNIATIHGVEEANGSRFIVMELLEGETLQKRLEHGPLTIDESLDIAVHITRALAVAHDAGIVHRDLKPANIMIGPQGHVKVLDFGLARDAGAGDGSASVDPTLLTGTDLMIGTAAYMSPEQAAGKPIDRRSDIFSFGCVLFEMLAGTRPFAGGGVPEIVAAILRDEPDWSELPESIPRPVRRLLRRCLQKDPERRLHEIADARIELEESASEPAAAPPGAPARAPAGWRRALPWVSAAIAATVTGVSVWFWTAPSLPTPVRLQFAHDVQPDTLQTMLAFSPDGTRLVYVINEPTEPRLYVRDITNEEARLIPGTEQADDPAFSPDGEWISFRVQREVKKVSTGGGAPTTIFRASGYIWGQAWGADNTIYVAVEGRGIFGVDPNSGDSALVVAPDRDKGEMDFMWPEVLPGGKALLFNVWRGGRLDDSPIVVYELDSGIRTDVVREGSYPKYASGHIVYIRRNVLNAVPFDPTRLSATGQPVAVLQGVFMLIGDGRAGFTLSQTGSLAYLAGDPTANHRELVLVDRTGRDRPLTDDRRAFMLPTVSPKGGRLAVSDEDGVIWIYDLQNGSRTRLTDDSYNIQPVWSPDGQRVTFVSTRDGPLNVFSRSADGTGEVERLWAGDNLAYPVSWSPDGQVLALVQVAAETGYDIMFLRVGDAPVAESFLDTPYREDAPTFSPDGHWIAYDSDKSGRREVYVAPFPGPGEHEQVSGEGGSRPLWSRDGTELFYQGSPTSREIYAVDIETDPEGRYSPPRLMFEYPHSGVWTPNWDVSGDGEHFVFVRSASSLGPRTKIHFILNWLDELKRLTPQQR